MELDGRITGTSKILTRVAGVLGICPRGAGVLQEWETDLVRSRTVSYGLIRSHTVLHGRAKLFTQ